MKVSPLLMNGEMVRATLRDIDPKTQTRRLVKGFALECLAPDGFTPEYVAMRENGNSKLGYPGDRLYVRETFCIETNRYCDDDYPPPHNDGRPIQRFGDDGIYWNQPHYRASDNTPELHYDDMDGPGCRWTPSIHMPRWASRVLLEITGLRIERLQDISEADVTAEGVVIQENHRIGYCAGEHLPPYLRAWRDLWVSINGADSWNANPWVWVIEFKRIEKDTQA